MADTIDALGSIAASGNKAVTIAVPKETQLLEINVGVEYAAVAGTSGVTVGLETSVDGTTFVTAKETAAEIKPAANVLGTESIIIRLGDDPYRLDGTSGSRLNSVKVTLTNTDATNAVSYSLSHEALSHQA